MRILFCNYEYPPLGGGGGVINALLAEELAKRHEVTVLTSKAHGQKSEVQEGKVHILRVPVWFRSRQATANLPSMLAYILRAPSVAGRYLDLQSYDVINTHFVLPSGPVGDRLARRYGIPNVLSLHGGDLFDPSKFTSPHRHFLLRMWVRRLVLRADAVVGQSTNTLSNLERYYCRDVKPIRIPLGIRRPPFGQVERKRYGIEPDEIILVTVGRLVARKAIHQLLEIVRRLSDVPVRLLVIGEGPLLPDLRNRAHEYGITEKVSFLGRVDETEKFGLLHRSDLFVSTSQHEGFGLVFLEAMACGLPIICYDHGGQTDFLSDSVNGVIVSLNDLDAFVRHCRELIERGEWRKRIEQVNLEEVEQYFIEHCADQYERVFEATIDQYEG